MLVLIIMYTTRIPKHLFNLINFQFHITLINRNISVILMFIKAFFHISLYIMKILICENQLEYMDTLKESLQEDCKLFISDNPYSKRIFEIIDSIDKGVKISHIAFLFHDRSKPTFPFLREKTQKPSEYFSNTFDTFLNHISLNHQNVIYDLISCNIDEGWVKRTISEKEKIHHCQIRYSFDETGSQNLGGNWIMESHQVNIKNIYFTENISNWNVTLQMSFHNGFIRNSTEGRRLFMMGNNQFGQLGLGITKDNRDDAYRRVQTPQDITEKIGNNTPSNIDFVPKMVACGRNHTLILSQDGRVAVCGSNLFGQLGLGQNSLTTATNKAEILTGYNDIIYVACGPDYSLLMSETKIIMFGNNETQVIRENNIDYNNRYIREPYTVIDLNNITDDNAIKIKPYSSFYYASCGPDFFGVVVKKSNVLNADGYIENYSPTVLLMRGKNTYGQLGSGDNKSILTDENGIYNIPFQEITAPNVEDQDYIVNGSSQLDNSKTNVTYISCGEFHTGIILTNIRNDDEYKRDILKPFYLGYAFTSGLNNHYQLGHTNTNNLNSFTQVKLKQPINKRDYDLRSNFIACGRNHTSILTSNGNILGFGKNYYRQTNHNTGLDDDLDVSNNGDFKKLVLYEDDTVDLNNEDVLSPLLAVSVVCNAFHSLILTSSNHYFILGESNFAFQDDSERKTQFQYVSKIVNVPRFDLIIYHNVTNHIAFICSDQKVYTFGLKGDSKIINIDGNDVTYWNNIKRQVSEDIFLHYNYELKPSDLSYSSYIYTSDVSGIQQTKDYDAGLSVDDLKNDVSLSEIEYRSLVQDGSGFIVEIFNTYDSSDILQTTLKINGYVIKDVSNIPIVPDLICTKQKTCFCLDISGILRKITEVPGVDGSFNKTVIDTVGINDIINIDCGLYHLAVIDSDFNLYTYLYNKEDLSGDEVSNNRLKNYICIQNDDDVSLNKWNEISFSDEVQIVDVKCGYEHTVCKTNRNFVYGFGSNKYGQLGQGSYLSNDKKYRNVPDFILESDTTSNLEIGSSKLKPIPLVKYVSCGNYHTTLLLENGCAYVYGLGYYNTEDFPYILRTHTTHLNKTNSKYELPNIEMINNVNPYQYIHYDLRHKDFKTTDYAYGYIDESGNISGWGMIEKGANINLNKFKNTLKNLENTPTNKNIYIHKGREGDDITSILKNLKFNNLTPLENTMMGVAENEDIVTYGYFNHYQNLSANRIPNNIDRIYKTNYSFTALGKDGKVYSWGKNKDNQDIKLLLEKDDNPIIVRDIITSDHTYTAVLNDKNKITW